MSIRTKVPTIPNRKIRQYRIITKPTIAAFCKGKKVERKVVSEEWLDVALLAAELDPNTERYFYEEIR